MSGKVDLHIHSTFSDGTFTPTDLVKMYKEDGYDLISITDHDETGGVEEAIEAGRQFGVKVVPGIEIGSVINDRNELHILGYDLDINDENLQMELSDMRDYRNNRNDKLLKVLQDKGYKITREDLFQRPDQDYIAKPNFALALVKRGYVGSVQEAFTSKDFLAAPDASALKQKKVDTRDAVRWILEAGGIAGLAHPMKIKGIGEKGSEEYFEELEAIVRQLAEMGATALECYHPSADEAQSERLVKMANKYQLLITRGSDYHGLR